MMTLQHLPIPTARGGDRVFFYHCIARRSGAVLTETFVRSAYGDVGLADTQRTCERVIVQKLTRTGLETVADLPGSATPVPCVMLHCLDGSGSAQVGRDGMRLEDIDELEVRLRRGAIDAPPSPTLFSLTFHLPPDDLEWPEFCARDGGFTLTHERLANGCDYLIRVRYVDEKGRTRIVSSDALSPRSHRACSIRARDVRPDIDPEGGA